MRKHTVLVIIIVTALLIFTMSANGAKKKKSKRKVRFGPKGMGINDATTCDEFSKNARFNPYSVVDEQWFVFFYWAYPMSPRIYRFAVPTANYTRHLMKLFDGNVTIPVNWTARHILMRDFQNITVLLVERNDRGYYWQYLYHYKTDGLMEPRDIRLKQTSDGRLIGYMDCAQEIVYVMSRINEVPPKNRLQEEASRIGYRCRRGRSYLYQGHEWMPVGEDDENYYWARHKHEMHPELQDPKSQQVLRDLATHGGLTDSEEHMAAPDLKDAEFADINHLQFNARATEEQTTNKEQESTFDDYMAEKLNSDLKNAELNRDKEDIQMNVIPSQSSEDNVSQIYQMNKDTKN